MKDGFYTMNFKTTTKSHFGDITAGYHSIDSAHATPHTGIDFAVPTGTEIHAPLDGVVSAVRDYGHTNLGKSVFVQTPDGQQYAVGHLSEIDVTKGQEIHHGDLLGLSGNTGHSTGPHLHFGVYDTQGHPIDPGNVTFDAFSGQPELAQIPHHIGVTVPDSLVTMPKVPSTETGGWLQDHVGGVAGHLLQPMADALGHGVTVLFMASMQYLPLVLTVGGMCCFVLTMAHGKGKFYGWGIASWALSALIRVISHGFGI